jgi:hypothetical protein
LSATFSHLVGWFDKVFIDQFDAWVLLGFVAQAFFTMRFLVQWIASERAKRSVVPIAFWFFSLAPVPLRHQAPGSGLHCRPGARPPHICPQSVADRQGEAGVDEQGGLNRDGRARADRHGIRGARVRRGPLLPARASLPVRLPARHIDSAADRP